MKTLKSINQEQVSKFLDVQPSQISEYYNLEDVTKDIISYIKAVKSGAMLCVIDSVSNSGMSRVISFKACEKSKSGFNYRQFSFLFKCLGYKETKKYSGKFRIGGCGMDMIFHTNYTNIHTFKRMGILSAKDCSTLSQKTPVVL